MWSKSEASSSSRDSSLAYAPQWTAIALAVGAGAIAQVAVEVCGLIGRTNGLGMPLRQLDEARFDSLPVSSTCHLAGSFSHFHR